MGVMDIICFPICFFILLLLFFSHPLAGAFDDNGSISSTSSVFSRLDFPPGFVFGAGSSAYQVEGAAAEDGRKPSIWDTFTHEGRTLDKATGDISSDQYHKYKDDVKLMHKMGLDAYRFSISWSRIIPDGRGPVNPKGVEYYNNLLNELVSYGIEAHVTLSHFDIPQALEDEYGGYLSPKLIEDFSAYADVCFKEYGDRVKSWMTFNEPNIQSVYGSDFGIMPPGRCSYPFGFDMDHPFAFGMNCSMGDSTTEPYTATHNVLLSHAAAVNLYRTKYQEKQKGQIGITLLAYWFEPNSSSPLDIAATKRAVDFHLGWYLEPLVYGRYPAIMRKIVGSRLPIFTKNELKQLKDSFDFIGLNYYCTVYVQDLQRTSDGYGSDYFGDVSIKLSLGNVSLTDFTRLKADMASVAGEGLQRLLEYVKLGFKNPAVAIHENGTPIARNNSSNLVTEDSSRITYLLSIIKNLLSSMRKGSDVRGYFVWTFVDCLEAFGGYTTNYGLYAVDFSDEGRRRYPRQSAHWYSTFLAKTGLKTETSSHFYIE